MMKWSKVPALTTNELLAPVFAEAMSRAVIVSAEDTFVMFMLLVSEPPENPLLTVTFNVPVESVRRIGPLYAAIALPVLFTAVTVTDNGTPAVWLATWLITK